MNRGSGNRPYVHSNVNNFMGDVSIGLTNTILAEMDINNLVKVALEIKYRYDRKDSNNISVK